MYIYMKTNKMIDLKQSKVEKIEAFIYTCWVVAIEAESSDEEEEEL